MIWGSPRPFLRACFLFCPGECISEIPTSLHGLGMPLDPFRVRVSGVASQGAPHFLPLMEISFWI
jgi:hypothetical protein